MPLQIETVQFLNNEKQFIHSCTHVCRLLASEVAATPTSSDHGSVVHNHDPVTARLKNETLLRR